VAWSSVSSAAVVDGGERQVQRAADVTGVPLVRVAHIDQRHLAPVQGPGQVADLDDRGRGHA
jgi:hypothetical protein